ncbi:polymorphic toxin type 8 domain-containing protein [Chryseobacterium sp. CCH4-E10]|uniref:polymorphic toxin type 8 domain-containing protein n=1 Tax=Chryseobacterium sp. CCH4-E10 TaxID=1768758 RepID=UPI001E4D7DF5|nr:polymorphic toxin type 8 domain-containing protein [Chryseobacterium sp. CCH4-E10]
MYNYKYNGKELQETGFYDYGWRQYMPDVGRWMQLDPLVEDTEDPYAYVFNNPIRLTDPDGRAPEDIRILGANGSSVTLKTDLIDVTVNASSLGVNFGGNYTLQGEDVLSAGLDIVGIFDPTGVADGINAGLQAKNGDWLSAGISVVGLVPYAGDVAKVGKIGKDVKIIEKAIDAVKSADNAKSLGRTGKQARLRELATDPKLGKADKGWLKSDINQVSKGKRTTVRNPPGKDLAHERGREAAKGYSYKYSHLQDRSLHRKQHKYDNGGRKNKERPVR